MAKTIAILNQKGGCGKTTSATNIASDLHRRGYEVILVSIDKQGSAEDWSAAKDEDADTFPVVSMTKTFSRDISKVSKGKDFVVIDGAPHISKTDSDAIKIADIVIVPIQPSPYDIWASQDTIDLLKARQEITDGKPKAAIMITMAMGNTNLTAESAKAVEGYEMPIMNNRTRRSVVYPETAAAGQSVFDLKGKKGELHPAAQDIKNITDEILEMIEND